MVREKKAGDRTEVDLTPTCHGENVPICFGLFKNVEYFSILLDELLALILLGLKHSLFRFAY